MQFDESILQEFTAQSKEYLTSFEDDLLQLERQSDQPDMETINKVFRMIHSIKGGAGFVGMHALKDLAHVMETLLSHMRAGQLRPEMKYVDALLEGADRINAMLDDTPHANDVPIDDVMTRLHALLGQAPPAPASAPSPAPPSSAGHPAPNSMDGVSASPFHVSPVSIDRIPPQFPRLYVLHYDLTELSQKEGKGPAALIKGLLKEGQILDGYVAAPRVDLRERMPGDHLICELLYATWLETDFLQVVATIPAENIRQLSLDELRRIAVQARQAAPEIAGAAATGAPRLVVEAPESAALPAVPEPADPAGARSESGAGAKTAVSAGKEGGETLRVNVGIIDKLMTLAGTLVLIRNQFLRAADSMQPASRPIAHGLDLVTSEIQECVMATRMQPVGNVFGRFPRVVRDLGKSLGKQIELEVTGTAVELDKTLIEALADPLTHLVRNSCDHGLEAPEVRAGQGKARAGHIRLSAFHEGGQVNIVIQDDGRGIDTAKVRARARERGLKSAAELDAMSEKEVYGLLFLPGFSTADQVSELSGRGVGLDVVRTSVQQLGGTIDVESSPGRGTTFQLRLPLTLAIIPCVIVDARGERFAIPQVNVEELVCLYDDDARKVEATGDRMVYRLRDRLLPIVSLAHSLSGTPSGTALDRSDKAPAPVTFTVLKAGAGRYGLIVDGIVGTEEIVVKPMHSALKRLNWYSGAAVMGDGRVALILDVEGVARNSGVDLTARDAVQPAESGGVQTTGLLLFRFGAGEQFAVRLSQIRRIERLRRTAIEHLGAREFARLKDRTLRVLRLNELITVSPLEPKELLYLLVPKQADNPFGLLAGALVDIVETALELDTQCLREPGVEGSATIRGKLTLVLDLPALFARAERRVALQETGMPEVGLPDGAGAARGDLPALGRAIAS